MKINNEFIEDFFGLYDPKDKYNFSISLDNIAKWMKSKKGDLKEAESYCLKIIYLKG